METPKSSTQLVAPDASKQKMVKIKTKKPIRLMREHPKKAGEYVEDVIPEGKEVMVTEEEAAEFCRKIEGHHAFVGERFEGDQDTGGGAVRRHDLTRAERV